jgi:hypothetical protein
VLALIALTDYYQIMPLLVLAFLFTCTPQALVKFATAQWQTDAQLRSEDAYKWIYQATRGGEHAMPDEQMAKNWLDEEWKTLGEPNSGEPLWQILCPGGEIGRLNLREFRARGGRKEDLLAAFVRSSQSFRNDESQFIAAWNELGRQLRRRSIGKLNWREWRELDRKMRAAGYPAIHHSKIFEQARRPAYRVLTGEEARRLIAALARP